VLEICVTHTEKAALLGKVRACLSVRGWADPCLCGGRGKMGCYVKHGGRICPHLPLGCGWC